MSLMQSLSHSESLSQDCEFAFIRPAARVYLIVLAWDSSRFGGVWSAHLNTMGLRAHGFFVSSCQNVVDESSSLGSEYYLEYMQLAVNHPHLLSQEKIVKEQGFRVGAR